VKDTELTHSQAYELWSLFGESMGIENLRKAYGSYWPRFPVFGERIWCFSDPDEKIGWAALRPDPVDPVVWQISGVFFPFRDLGYMREIFRWCIKKTFTEYPKSQAMFYSISKRNQRFLDWNLAETRKINSKMEKVGEINFPDPYIIFAIKEGKIYGSNHPEIAE